ncbi:MAG TPA: GTPase ObgE [Candidatus Saccharimonadales bacterium]|nr:GTPase ObgE [Candidatus Saccharimonadales bacterium]
MFVDKVTVQVKAGDGGNGAVSFRHEKFVEKGGPDGGDGGTGGSVIFVADPNQNTLVQLRYKQELVAKPGVAGFHRKQHGRAGEDLLVKVPVGTQVFHDGQLIADFTTVGQQEIVAHGGDGGFGNAHFKSSVRQAPRVAELGEKGEQKELVLELKLLADVGLVGFPNAGKSTFLSVVSNARPEIGDYPFTTLIPQLGVADIDDTSLLIADIPGLIEGASQGKGLGDEFLRHVERTQVLLHLIDIYEPDVAAAYKTINSELSQYSKELSKRPQIVVLTKIDGLPQDGIDQQVARLKSAVQKGTEVFAISSQAHIGVKEVLRKARILVETARAKVAEVSVEEPDTPVIRLDAAAQDSSWQVTTTEAGEFIVSGAKIERFAARTNFETEPGVRRLRDIMRRTGIMHELERQGIQPGNSIIIGGHRMPY